MKIIKIILFSVVAYKKHCVTKKIKKSLTQRKQQKLFLCPNTIWTQ